jgi:hypothetical protein
MYKSLIKTTGNKNKNMVKLGEQIYKTLIIQFRKYYHAIYFAKQ